MIQKLSQAEQSAITKDLAEIQIRISEVEVLRAKILSTDARDVLNARLSELGGRASKCFNALKNSDKLALTVLGDK